MFGLFEDKPKRSSEAYIVENEVLHKQLEVLQQVSNALIQQDDLDKTLKAIVTGLATKLGYINPVIYLISPDHKSYSVRKVNVPEVIVKMVETVVGKPIYDVVFKMSDQNQLTQVLTSGEPIVSTDFGEMFKPYLNSTAAKIAQSSLRISSIVIMPILVDSVPIGCLTVGERKTEVDEMEMQVIHTFAEQISIAIYNSQQSEQRLKHIGELENKNKELQSLYSLTNNISKTLDPTAVSETAVNTLPQDEVMFGAFLNFYDKITGDIYMKALTQNAVSSEIEKLIGGYDKYKSNVNDEAYSSNPIAVAVKTGQMQVTNSLAELMSPPMPKALVLPIQKLVPVTSAVVYPLKFRNDTVGTITFLLKSKIYEELEDNKKQLLSTYALQIGIALENANLFTNLGAALDQLKEARRRERDMLDVMGHELRTPISIVRNALLMLDRDYTKTDGAIAKETLRKYLDMAIESVRREITLIETLLSATKIDASRMQLFLSKVDFKDVVGDGIEGQRMMVQQKGLTLNFNPPSTPVDVFADRTRTQEIMDNFLSNSAKYTNTGSINISVWADDNYGYISIKDTGMGISEEDLQNLGKKFFRAKQYIPTQDAKGVGEFIRPGGTGLGLYVTFDLIRIMGGRLYINSKVGEGSVFTFSLPKYKDQKDSQIDETFSSDATAKKEHVFLNSPEAPQPPQA